jgi:hypothetical protein
MLKVHGEGSSSTFLANNAIDELVDRVIASETARVAAEADRDRAVAEVRRLRQVVMSAPFSSAARGGEENVRSNHGAAPGVTTSRPAEGSDEPGTSSHPAPSPSVPTQCPTCDRTRPDGAYPTSRCVRIDCPVAYARNVNGVWKGISLASDEDRSYLDAAVRDWGGTVHALYTAPPDLAAEIAKLKAEVIEYERMNEHRQRLCIEVVDLRAQLDGTRREFVSEWWEVRDPKWRHMYDVDTRAEAEEWREEGDSIVHVRRYRRMKPKPRAPGEIDVAPDDFDCALGVQRA